MATLDQAKIKELWETPKNKSAIERAALDNQRQLFHAQLSVDRNDSNANPYLNVFRSRIRSILNNTEKFLKVDNLLSFPLASNHLISKATDEWNKVFKAQDRVEEFKFTDEAAEADFEMFLDKINFRATIEQNLFTKVKQAVNTIAIVDVAQVEEDQSTARITPGFDAASEPYVYFIETGQCHDIEVNHAGAIKYLFFEKGSIEKKNRQLVVIDDEYYRVFDILEDNQIVVNIESEHFLGFCPASFIWGDVIDPDNTIRRFNSVLEIVDDLDAYIIAKVFGEYADLYASFPIVWRYEDACDPAVEEAKRAEYTTENGTYVGPETDYLGPGHEIRMTVPEGESAKMNTPIGFVNSERQMLDYNREKIRNLEIKIIKHLTGVDNEIQNEKAFNESQIRSQYETRHSVLRYWAENMQFIHKFLLVTIAKLRYGDTFVSATIDYGMDYFLYDTITATTDYKDAKEAGLPQFIVASRREVVMQIETRNSPNKKARFDVLAQLEPYIDVPLEKVDPLTEEYELKANFQFYIDRFEREEKADIVTFGSLSDFNEKINTIKSKLYEYVAETRESQKQRNIQATSVRQPGQGTEVQVSG